MRTIAFLLLIATTVCAQANPTLVSVGPNTSITPEELGRGMSGVAACAAAPGAPPFDPVPQTMFLEVFIVKGTVTRVSAMTSSGNPTFDQKAIQCLQNLPIDFTTKVAGDLLMSVSVRPGNGAVVPDPSVTVTRPETAIFSTGATQHAPAPPGAAPSTPGAAPAGPPAGGCVAYYPPIAVRLSREGDTELVFTIATDGTVKDVSVSKSSGFVELDQAAAHCVAFWRYKPATRNGMPIAVQWHSVVRFRLGGGAPSPEAAALQMASQRSLSKLFHDSYACLNAAQIDENELAKSSHAATGLTVHFSQGVISSVDMTHSSGDTTLDGLAVNCFQQQKYDAEMAQTLVHQKNWYVPVVWSIIK